MCKNPYVVFPNNNQMIQHAILSLGAKTMEQYVMPTLDSGGTIIFFFQLMYIIEKTHLLF
jgi:hypothetical protein